MKKLLYIIFVFIIFSCDDGDIVFQDSTFTSNELKSCNLVTPENFYLFKIEGDKSLILQLGNAAANLFKRELTNSAPRTIAISGNIKLIERVYNRALGPNDICNLLPPTGLQVTREWQSVSGTISVTTTAIRTEPNANGETRIQKFRHQIVVNNLTINRDGQLQTFDVYPVGFYEEAANAIPSFNSAIKKCPSSNRYYLNNNNSIFELVLPDAMFANVNTPVGAPRQTLISSTNTLTLRQFPFEIPTDVCSVQNNTAIEVWVADNGVANLSGIIEVITTSAPNPTNPAETDYSHKVTLKKIKFKRSIPNDGLDFQYGDVIEMGVYNVRI
jgi:hypothetical protein